MKNKVFKKTIAAALALTLMGGGLPTAIAGTNIFEPGIIATAEGTLIATGNVYYLGDTIDFGSDDVYVKILNSVDLDDSITLKIYVPVEQFDDAGVNKVTLSGPNDAIEITSFVKDKTFYNSNGFVKIHAILSPDFIIQNGSSIVSVYDKIDESADYNYYYIQEP